MCVSHEVCSYNQSVRCLLLLSGVLCRRRRRLSRLCLCVCRCGGWARWRRVHKHFICHPKSNLLPLIHVEVMSPLVSLIFPQPNLLCFITAAVAKDGSTITTNLRSEFKSNEYFQTGYNFAGCWSDSGGMRMSSKKPIVTVKQKGYSDQSGLTTAHQIVLLILYLSYIIYNLNTLQESLNKANIFKHSRWKYKEGMCQIFDILNILNIFLHDEPDVTQLISSKWNV